MGKFRTTWLNLRRTPYQTLAAFSTMTLTLFVLSIFLLTAFGSQKILSYFETKPQITAFFSDEAKPEDIEALKQKIAATGRLASQRYVSKEEALDIYKEQNKNDPLLLEMVTSNILPASLEVSATEAKYLPQINDILKETPFVSDVTFQKDVVDTLIAWTNALRIGGVILVGFLIFNALLTILTVIGMKISTKKEEVEIMKLIGASNWYIRWPFIMEGVIYGFVSGVLAWVASIALLLYITPPVSSFLQGIPLLPYSWAIMFIFLGIIVSSGILVGIIGSFLALWRHLRN